MRSRILVTIALLTGLAGLLLPGGLPAARAAGADAYGDPLPAGALQRLGSTRLKYASLNDARYLPDGRVLVLVGANLDLLDMSTGRRLEQRKLPLSAVALRVGADGHTLLLTGTDGSVCLYDLATGKELRRWPTGQAGLRGAEFSPDGTRALTVGRMPPTLKEWSLADGSELGSITGKSIYFDDAVYALGGKVAVAGGGYDTMEFWSLETYQLLEAVKTGYCVYELCPSPDGARVLAAERSAGTEWDVASRKLLQRFTGHHGGAVTGQCYAAAPGELLTGSRDGSIRRWDRVANRALVRWVPHAVYASRLRLSPDGKWVLSYSSGQYLTESDVQTGRQRLPLERHVAAVETVSWTPDGKVLSGSLDATARLWDPESGKCLVVLAGGLGASCVAAPPDGQRLTLGGKDALIREYDRAGKLLRELKGHRGYVRALCYLPEGRLASAADDGTIRLWGEGTEPLAVLEGHRGGVLALTLVDDTHLASAGRDGSVRLWDLGTAKQLWSKVEHRGYVTCLAAEASGRFYSSGRDGRVLHWDLKGLLQGELAAGGWVNALAARRDGGVVFAGAGANVAGWDAAGKGLPPLTGHAGGVNALAVSPDGKRLVSGSADGTLLVWPAAQ